MNYKGFRIDNQPAYVWRMHCWNAHADHNWIACWYVFDAEGKRVTGGYDSGNNTRSGSAGIPRRKDAKAWIDGYLAYRSEPENRKETAAGHCFYLPATERRLKGYDHEQQQFFDSGYWKAHQEDRRAKKTA